MTSYTTSLDHSQSSVEGIQRISPAFKSSTLLISRYLSVIDCNHSLIGLEVRAFCVSLCGHPHTLAVAGDGLRCFHIGQHDVTIKVIFVDPPGWGVEASSPVHIANFLVSLALLPDVDMLFCNLGIKRNNREISDSCQLFKLCIKCNEHAIGNAARLVN